MSVSSAMHLTLALTRSIILLRADTYYSSFHVIFYYPNITPIYYIVASILFSIIPILSPILRSTTSWPLSQGAHGTILQMCSNRVTDSLIWCRGEWVHLRCCKLESVIKGLLTGLWPDPCNTY